MPIASGHDAWRWDGRYAIRAVASVWPYITTSSAPASAARLRHRSRASGAMRPPAWVRSRTDGARTRSAAARSSRSNVWGTPAMEVTPLSCTARAKQGSTTEASTTAILAPAARWECRTDNP